MPRLTWLRQKRLGLADLSAAGAHGQASLVLGAQAGHDEVQLKVDTDIVPPEEVAQQEEGGQQRDQHDNLTDITIRVRTNYEFHDVIGEGTKSKTMIN